MSRKSRHLVGRNELTFEDLKLLLIDNEVKNFDPVAEAFKVYDPEGKTRANGPCAYVTAALTT